MRIDSHHSFSERHTLDFLGTILKRNRFEGSIVVTGHIAHFPDFVQGIVIEADLRDPHLPHLLDRCQLDPRFKGVCYRFTDEFPDGLAELQRRGITLDANGGAGIQPAAGSLNACPPVIASIVERFPAMRIVIDHLGVGDLDGDEWARQIERIAQSPQVYCKLSGVAHLRPSPRPYVQHALAVFGPRRLMFGSDWPSGLPDITWKASLAAFTQAIGAQSMEVREELLGGTAERFYGLHRGSFAASV